MSSLWMYCASATSRHPHEVQLNISAAPKPSAKKVTLAERILQKCDIQRLLALEPPARERQALLHAVDKLAALGATLGHPHTSQVRGADGLRELRPRAGRSPWRAFYRRVGAVLVIASVGPEAEVDPLGFRAAIAAAERRLAESEEEGKKEAR